MKGIIDKDFYTNRVIVGGTEVIIHYDIKADGSDVLNYPCGVCVLCENEAGVKEYIPLDCLTITDHTPAIDWEQRRYEIAKEVLPAIHKVVNETYVTNCRDNPRAHYTPPKIKNICREALDYADELIKQLKGGSNE